MYEPGALPNHLSRDKENFYIEIDCEGFVGIDMQLVVRELFQMEVNAKADD